MVSSVLLYIALIVIVASLRVFFVSPFFVLCKLLFFGTRMMNQVLFIGEEQRD